VAAIHRAYAGAAPYPAPIRTRHWWTTLFHFVLIGAVLFAARRWLPTSRSAGGPVVVASAAQVDDELLYREALAQGFDRRDPIVRQRLVALARYLDLAAADDDAALERQARALGLERSDPTVRRHLIEMLRLAAANLAPDDMPDEKALRAYYAAHGEEFTRPLRTTLTHVFISRDLHGDDTSATAAALLKQLRASAVTPAAAAGLGDPFPRGGRVSNASSDNLARSFGSAFSAAVAQLPQGAWSGPVASPYGLHLVFVEERRAEERQPFATAQNRVMHGVLRERGAARLRATLDRLRRRYDVRVVPAASTSAPNRADDSD